MLVLSRKIGEKILIGNDIVLVVIDVKGGRIKLGIEAPAELSIQRSELSSVAETKSPVVAAAFVERSPLAPPRRSRTWENRRRFVPKPVTSSVP